MIAVCGFAPYLLGSVDIPWIPWWSVHEVIECIHVVQCVLATPPGHLVGHNSLCLAISLCEWTKTCCSPLRMSTFSSLYVSAM